MRDYEIETWAPDFDDVKLDTMIMFEKARFVNLWTYQFGVEEGVFVEYERRLQNKGIQRGELFYLTGTASLLMERIT